MKKITATICATALLAGIASGCGKNETQVSGTGDITITFWGIMDGNAASAGVKRYSDMMMFKQTRQYPNPFLVWIFTPLLR